MKKYILLIIPFIISCSSPEPINADVMLIERGGEYFSAAKNKPYSGPFFTLHDNGELKSEGNLKKGNLDDAFKEYSESGQILTDVTYKNGILNGPYKEYFNYLKGLVSEKGTYKNGKKDGPYTAFGLDSEVVWEGTYDNGKSDAAKYDELDRKNGIIYLKNTNKPYSGPYIEEGITLFFLDGKQRILKRDWGSGSSFESYKDGKEDGLFLEYENGILLTETNYKDGEKDGPFKEYYENGQLKEEGTYKDGKIDGLNKEYDENGELFLETTYKDGKKDGLSKIYYNGKLYQESAYKDGDKLFTKEYDKNGRLKKEWTY